MKHLDLSSNFTLNRSTTPILNSNKFASKDTSHMLSYNSYEDSNKFSSKDTSRMLSYNSYKDPSKSPAGKKAGYCGLRNLGNTCFMNSALQCLSNTPTLTDYFLRGRHQRQINRTNPLGMPVISKFAPQFSGYRQHDNGIHEDLNQVKNKPYREMPDDSSMQDIELANLFWQHHTARNQSIIVNLFHGQFKSRVQCPEKSCTFYFFFNMYLSVPVVKKSRGRSSSTHLRDCLAKFSTQEQLGKNDQWYCSKCKKFKQAYKQLTIWKLPRILVLHLKRFQHGKYRRSKLETLVEFPISGLDMSSYLVPGSPDSKMSNLYDLIAVSNHSGNMRGGHYTACGLNQVTGQWLCFNDAMVSSVSESSLVSKSAYILFYKRRQ
eukprot:GSMAST32.ASY1.ANO1.2812.1 assembled CDS